MGLLGTLCTLAVLTAVSAAAPAPLTAQGESSVDQGSFELRVAGRTVGSESFEIRRTGRQVRAAGRILLDSAVAGLRPLEVLLEADAEQVPQLLRLRTTAGSLRGVTAVREEERLRVQVSSDEGDRWKEFVASPEVVLVEPGIAHHWGLLLGRLAERLAESPMIETPAVVPSEARRTTLRLRREGPDRVDVPGADRDGVRYTASLGGEGDILIWTSEEGQLLRVESPRHNTVAVRHPAP